MDLERTLKGGRDQEQRTREERLEMSGSLVEEMALEERNAVEDFKRVRWADLEDEEQSSRYEQMAEKEEIISRSETRTETPNDNETWQGGQPQQENTTQAADDDDDKARQGGRQEQEDTRQAKDDDNDETRQGDQQQQEDDGPDFGRPHRSPPTFDTYVFAAFPSFSKTRFRLGPGSES